MKSVFLALLSGSAIIIAFWLGYEYRNYELAVQQQNLSHTENTI